MCRIVEVEVATARSRTSSGNAIAVKNRILTLDLSLLGESTPFSCRLYAQIRRG